MTVEQTVSASVGVLSAVASATLQATGQQGGLTAPVVSAITEPVAGVHVLVATTAAAGDREKAKGQRRSQPCPTAIVPLRPARKPTP